MDESISITHSDKQLISNLAEKIVRHGMAIPAILFLEMGKYLSFFGAQLMIFFGPIITVFIPFHSYYKIRDKFQYFLIFHILQNFEKIAFCVF